VGGERAHLVDLMFKDWLCFGELRPHTKEGPSQHPRNIAAVLHFVAIKLGTDYECSKLKCIIMKE
jgi:hypothetical protein